jgi:hypothetical protein
MPTSSVYYFDQKTMTTPASDEKDKLSQLKKIFTQEHMLLLVFQIGQLDELQHILLPRTTFGFPVVVYPLCPSLL